MPAGTCDIQMKRLQSVQNAGARLASGLMNSTRRDYIPRFYTASLIQQRVIVRLPSWCGLANAYLHELCMRPCETVRGRAQLRCLSMYPVATSMRTSAG